MTRTLIVTWKTWMACGPLCAGFRICWYAGLGGEQSWSCFGHNELNDEIRLSYCIVRSPGLWWEMTLACVGTWVTQVQRYVTGVSQFIIRLPLCINLEGDGNTQDLLAIVTVQLIGSFWCSSFLQSSLPSVTVVAQTVFFRFLLWNSTVVLILLWSFWM